MATLGSLVVSLECSAAKFEQGLNRAEYLAKKSSDAIATTLKTVGVAVAGMLSVSKFEAMFKDITTMESNLLKMASRLNTNVETLSSFGVMARKTGMDSDSFNMALTRMEKGLSAAALGAETSTGKFDENGEEILKTASTYRELGLRAEVLIKLPLDQRLLAISAAMKENIAPTDQVRIAMELFGRGGAGMVNVFKEGPEAMQKWIDRQKELGIITTDMAKRGAAAKSAASDLTAAWSTFARELVDAVAPAITMTTNALTAMIIAARKGPPAMAFAAESAMQYALDQAEMQKERKLTIPPSKDYLKARTEPERFKPAGAGKGGKTETFTEVTEFDQWLWKMKYLEDQYRK